MYAHMQHTLALVGIGEQKRRKLEGGRGGTQGCGVGGGGSKGDEDEEDV